jgi:hypothetical protein
MKRLAAHKPVFFFGCGGGGARGHGSSLIKQLIFVHCQCLGLKIGFKLT